ncbi:MAG: TetR/AcrR family transcriptional regulator [Acidimicrobiales bacterium]
MAEGDVRAELLAAGETAFATRGYAATTVDDVIRLSGTSRATFYRYFGGKEQLFEELSRACFREMRDAVRAFSATAHGPVGRLEIIGLLERYQGLNDRFGGVIRAWTELTGPADSPMHDRGTVAVRAIFHETAALLDRNAAAAGTPQLVAEELTTRAALLFLLVERSVFYVSNRVSRLDPQRLGPTLATLVERAYLGTSP